MSEAKPGAPLEHVVPLPSSNDESGRPIPRLAIEDFDRSSEWLRTFADSTPTAIFVYTPERFLWVNEAFERLAGRSRAELFAGLTVFDLVDPEARPFLRERWEERVSGGNAAPRRYEVRLRSGDGGEKWADVSFTAVQFRGEVVGLGSAIDVTERRRAERALALSEERLVLAQRAAEILAWDWNLADDSLYFSSPAESVLGLDTPGVTTSKQFFDRVHPQDLARVQVAIRRALEDGEDYFAEHRLLLPGGQTRWLAQRGQVMRDADGRPHRVIGVSLDITNRKLAEEALFQEKERAQVTLASIGDGVIRTDSRAMIDYMNPAAERLTGWRLHEAYGRHLREVFQVVDPATHTLLLDPVTRCLAEGRYVEFPGERMLQPRNGGPLPVRDSASPILNRNGRATGAVLAFKDISELRSIEQERSFFSKHDPLTGLLNRQAFEDEVESAVASAKQSDLVHVVGYLDLDQFRLINDTCGHFVGDELLKQVVQRLAARLGEDDLLARLGGDEFGFLFRATSLPGALLKAQELRRALQESRFSWQDRVFEILASVGLVPVTEESRDGAAVLAAADAACAVAKERGGNRVHEYRPSDHAIAKRVGEMQWIQQIHQAFEAERFELHAQRIVPLSAEAQPEPLAEIFIRMTTERGESVPTAAFIAAAERYHLISTMDRWVIRESFGLLGGRGPRRPLFDATYTLNLSGQSLGEEALLEHVLREIERSGVDPRRVCFEITETAAIANLTSALRFISALKSLGCRFVLDDFGSGFSSFAYLKNLPVDFLKIDASFTRQLPNDRIQRALVESMQQIGRVLGMKTIAEGVEDEATIGILRELGVDYAQGFALHRPEPLVAES
ncbi:MAG: EAL domain-containing protein [Thermoanaerobaculia bacterium]